MYPLIPKAWWVWAVAIISLIAIFAASQAEYYGLVIAATRVASTLAGILVFAATIFGGSYYYAPWRFFWRLIPALNKIVFPDLNGVWIGSTNSNWPTIQKMLEAAQAYRPINLAELEAIKPREDAIAVEIRASLFSLKIFVAASATYGQSHSLIAHPRRDPDSEKLFVTNVYRQSVPNHQPTDEASHLGAADLQISSDDHTSIEGEYWTRRKWQLGLNTAGRIKLKRISDKRQPKKDLMTYALEKRGGLSKL